ncbi:MAG: M1 family metallopeptidase [Anaerolineae bacterium]
MGIYANWLSCRWDVFVMMRCAVWLFLVLGLVGCSPRGDALAELPLATLVPTMPTVRIQASVPPTTPTPTRELRSVEAATPTVTPTAPPPMVYRCGDFSDPYPVHYDLIANVDYANKTVDVAQTVHFRNRTDETLTDLVMAIEANSVPEQFQLGQIRFNNVEMTYILDVNRLWIPLPVGLEPGCEVSVDLTFRLRVPRIGDARIAYKGYLGYSERQINLGNWMPVMAPRMGGHWIVNDVALIGEQTVSDQARWTVILNVLNAPDGLVMAMPGEVTQLEPHQWRSEFDGGRDFTVSMSPFYRVLRQRAFSGVEVELYAFPDAIQTVNGMLLDGAAHALTEATKAFQQFEALFGRYPFTRLAIVQGDFPDGMEFSGLVYVSTTWFYSFRGGVRNYLTIITVHEVAHQWWYMQVGNNAALVPWLDEALSTYSEYIYYEEFYPQERDWWWSTRVGYFDPRGKVDSTVYEFSTPRDYINAVYLRGVQMLQRLREDIGTEAFFDLLATYAERSNGRIATSETFWELLSPTQWEQTTRTREQFLRDPVLGRP